MTAVTIATLAYVATLVSALMGPVSLSLAYVTFPASQVRFSLTSSAVFSRNDTTTDSERFYGSIIRFLQLPSVKAEVDALLN